MNKYLEKIAERQVVKGLAEAELARRTSSGAASRLLGYTNLYHGTSKDAAAKIKKEGLRTSFGGEGASVGSKAYVERSKGTIHLSPKQGDARFYAGYGQAKQDNPGIFEGDRIGKGFSARLNPFNTKGEILKTRMPFHKAEGLGLDTDHIGAVKSTKNISSRRIVDGRGYQGLGQVVNGRNLKKYYSSSKGLMRAAGGAAQVVGASALAADSFRRLTDTTFEKKAYDTDRAVSVGAGAAGIGAVGAKFGRIFAERSAMLNARKPSSRDVNKVPQGGMSLAALAKRLDRYKKIVAKGTKAAGRKGMIAGALSGSALGGLITAISTNKTSTS